MDLAVYVALTRQSGLAKELQSVANNIANLSTTGYRREGVIFAEEVQALPVEGGSVAMTEARARYTEELQGSLQETGGSYDLAIEGEGYFTVMTPAGQRLTRAGLLRTERRRGARQPGRARPARRGRRRDRDSLRGEERRHLVGRDHLGRWPAGGAGRAGDGRGPHQALPRGGRALPRRHRDGAGRGPARAAGVRRAVERQPGDGDGADGRGAAGLRVRPEAARPGGRAYPAGGASTLGQQA